jgi:hypothetical protein
MSCGTEGLMKVAIIATMRPTKGYIMKNFYLSLKACMFSFCKVTIKDKFVSILVHLMAHC